METKEKALLFWSGGKESALSHYKINQENKYEIVSLLSIFNRETSRIQKHGISDTIVINQAKMMNLPLLRIFIPSDANVADYVKIVTEKLSLFASKGVRTVIFGDVYDPEKKHFLEKILAPLEIKVVFPLWEKSTQEIATEFLSSGHKAIVTGINTDILGPEFLNAEYSQEYIDSLPEGVDPIGEKGEFQTFVIFGPAFKMRVAYSKAIAVNEKNYLVSLIKEP